MDIAKVILNLKTDYLENKVQHSEFVDFMEQVKNPYLVLICCILSLRTNDKITIGATKRMLKIADNPFAMAKVKPEDLQEAIYPVGFYKNKAQQIIDLSVKIAENNGIVPDEIEELI